MEIAGYNTVGENRIPIFAGPCKGCGSKNYGLSTSGPDYCGSCACGVDPKLTRLRQENEALGFKYIDALLAIEHLLGRPLATDKMRERATEFIRRYEAGEDLTVPR